MKTLFIIIVLIAVVIVAIFVIFRPSPPGDIYNGDTNGIILFYGEGCPHCKNVDDYLKQNNIEGKVQFQKLEVFNNNIHADLLGELAARCGLDKETIGVPFLWNGASSTCASGDVDVVNFFKAKIGG